MRSDNEMEMKKKYISTAHTSILLLSMISQSRQNTQPHLKFDKDFTGQSLSLLTSL